MEYCYNKVQLKQQLALQLRASFSNQLTSCIPISDVASRHLRSASRHHLVVPRHNLSTYGRRAFAVAGSAAWNSLSDDLRDPALSTDSFRRVLKTRLFSEY